MSEPLNLADFRTRFARAKTAQADVPKLVLLRGRARWHKAATGQAPPTGWLRSVIENKWPGLSAERKAWLVNNV